MPSRILLIYTGGTIGMEKSASGALTPFDISRIQYKVPELQQLDFEVDTLTFGNPIDSSDMTPTIWLQLAELIEANYIKYDGFVILHGTDTMAYTASALSFLLCNLNKPVILTGSQLPLGILRTDGKENIITALQIASAKQNHQAIVPEVCIFFQNRLYRGNRTTKYNAENFRAFRSDNYPVLAEAGLNIKYNFPFIRYNLNNLPFSTLKNIDNNVALLKLFPGISQPYLNAVINTPKLRGLVIETFGSGNSPTAPWFFKEIEAAIKNNLIVYNVTQCIAGKVEMDRYQSGQTLYNLGVISGNEITSEAAITKLMILLGTSLNQIEIKSELIKSLRGEIDL